MRFLYLNTSSNHPKHVKRNIPKGQFIRVRRICSKNADFYKHCTTLASFFEKRGYNKIFLERSIKEVSKITREKLLEETMKVKQDPQMIFVCDWHPNLSRLSTSLKKHFHLLQNDRKAKKVFTSTPMVAYRRTRTLKNILVKNKLSEDCSSNQNTKTEPCRKPKCRMCKDIASTDTITNKKKNIKIKAEAGGNCQTTNLIYAVICTRHNAICVGQTGCSLASRFSKHRHDIKNRPDNTEIAEHFHKGHQEGDMKVMILQTGLSQSQEQREHFEDRWICRLQSLQHESSSGINKSMKVFGKEMYESFAKINN